MIDIKVNQNAIPVKIGALDFEYRMDDQSVTEFEEKAKNAESTMNNIVKDYKEEKIKEGELVSLLNSELSDLFGIVLGEGSYDSIYKQHPSALDNMEVFMQLMAGIRAESDKRFEKKEKERKKKISSYKKRATQKVVDK